MSNNDIIIQEENKADSQALAAVQNTGGKLASLPSVDVLKAQLERAAEYRELISGHIKSTFSKNIHYYKYHYLSSCKIVDCDDPKHLSPNWEITAQGARNLIEDFLFFPDFKPDEESRKMFGDPNGLVCLIGYIYTIEGKFFSAGRGSCRINSYTDENRALKMAQKRALIDALKNSGLLADFEKTICEKEGEVQHIPSAQNSSSASNKCDTCPSTGKYHAKTCPKFTNQNIQEGDIL